MDVKDGKSITAQVSFSCVRIIVDNLASQPLPIAETAFPGRSVVASLQRGGQEPEFRMA
jgi:hypothetical protein